MDLAVFSERLADLIFETGKIARDVAPEIGISKSTIYEYLSGTKMPTLQNLIKIADFFNCSADYLFGREEFVNGVTYKQCKAFSERFKEILAYYKLSRYKLEKLTGISESVLYYWAKGDKTPSVERIIHVCTLLDCSIDFFIGRTDVP